MKKMLLFFILFPLVMAAQVNPKGFTIEGKLEGFPEGTEILLYKNGENVEMVKTKLLKTKFTLKGNVKEPVLCYLIITGQNPVEIYVENATISFKGKKAQPLTYQIEGSKSHKEFDTFIKGFMPLAKQVNSLANTINSTMPGADRDKLMVTYNSTQEMVQKEIDKFIKDKPKSYVAPFILNVTHSFNENIVMLESRFKSLDEKIRQSEADSQFEQYIADGKIGAIGTEALDFSQPDTTGTPISLSSFRGKYVLVDFWASWCGPCRAENPNVVENYNKFNSKNFTVLGVSLDRPGQKDKWINAIHEDNLTWTHVSDLQFWSNSAALLYKVKGIPQNILVNPEGKIVAKNLRGPALEAKLCELLGCEPKAF
ncbi:MAG: AhpC/TSA family protein [Chitinophagaceae bacterium]|nr:AhpC/TSA family protein [Chitinophagaceae bacterium]